ncbi:inheritance of peroxisomes protein 1-domain-containing protein [Calycina marina]|uniref:Inheritance of peroxisomes protein 1 n=1 Tax=Calycina marina TaxID=1763456 RepID=A0A9P8CE27_9HELO|nr:inheritance of peroxisomes protein 1-domain-containing protein [Calycina marina]
MATFTPTTPVARRAFSLPVGPSTCPAATTPDAQIEVLFNLPSVRIISFTTTAPVISPGSRPASRAGFSNGSLLVVEEPGTLSWTSKYERQIAIGSLRIYRAPGSVAFLSCSSALKPILPKSQCWMVDEESGKFVLQIRPPQYWRIEVPNTNEVERLRIDGLKDVLDKVLQFERTPCPFQRDFAVELPASPITPVKKRPWKPVARPKLDVSSLSMARDVALPILEPVEESASIQRPGTPASAISRDILEDSNQFTEVQAWAESLATEPFTRADNPEDIHQLQELAPYEQEPENCEGIPGGCSEISLEIPIQEPDHHGYQKMEECRHNFSNSTKDMNVAPRTILQPAFQSPTLESEKESHPNALKSYTRCITAPPVLSLVTSPPSKTRRKSPLRVSVTADSDSGFSSSVESFHTVQSWHSPLAPPSPPASKPSSPHPMNIMYPYPHDNIVLRKRVEHSREILKVNATPVTAQCWVAPTLEMEGTISTRPRTPTLTEDNNSEDGAFEIATPPTTIRPRVRHRATTSSNSRRRELSPLPAVVNLFTPTRRSRHLQTNRHLPTAIIQKTCEILLSPPSHLFSLMLSIASKIAAGEWRGVLSGYGDSVHWDFEDEYAAESWAEDDYGISLQGQESSRKPSRQRKSMPGGSWEVD